MNTGSDSSRQINSHSTEWSEGRNQEITCTKQTQQTKTLSNWW